MVENMANLIVKMKSDNWNLENNEYELCIVRIADVLADIWTKYSSNANLEH
jgi:hypothetical protein